MSENSPPDVNPSPPPPQETGEVGTPIESGLSPPPPATILAQHPLDVPTTRTPVSVSSALSTSAVSNPHADKDDHRNSCIWGVVEGFYGRPWTTEQRKDLFAKMKRMGLNTYMYAPKDDFKHRAYWRDLYTVEEADHLTGLIEAAHEEGINFYYAISPGIDITYSNTKEVAALKRKLEQVSQFGCVCFAILFDDIEPEISETDKEVFHTFAEAQVSVSNEVYQALGHPKGFMFCPTEYCAARAVPNVINSEYLNTIGSKLLPEIDIMWTGPKVISKHITIESILELSDVLRRKPVIWDNLHANDYDQKRLFLGPYSGRSTDLIPHLRGVLTNPNNEYEPNFIAIHTLAQWSKCNSECKLFSDAVRSDIQMEVEPSMGPLTNSIPSYLSPSTYHPRKALQIAIAEWLPEFYRIKHTHPPIPPPSPGVPNPDAEVQPPNKDLCNSLAAPDAIVLAPLEAMDCGAAGNPHLDTEQPTEDSTVSERENDSQKDSPDDSTMEDSTNGSQSNKPHDVLTGAGQPCDKVHQQPASLDSADMDTDSLPPVDADADKDQSPSGTSQTSEYNGHCETSKRNDSPRLPQEDQPLTLEDISLLIDLFYLPFEHGWIGIQLINVFHWLYTHAESVRRSQRMMDGNSQGSDGSTASSASPDTSATSQEEIEWRDRALKFDRLAQTVSRLVDRFYYIKNRSLHYDIYPYLVEIKSIISSLRAFIGRLGDGGPGLDFQKTKQNSSQCSWFSRGYSEAFSSGEQEPWSFRGGLIGELQRLLPLIENQNHETPNTNQCSPVLSQSSTDPALPSHPLLSSSVDSNKCTNDQ